MESKRQKQVAELVKRNFSLVLQQEGGYLYGHQVMVTVTNVHMSPDLALAKIYLSVFNTEQKQEPLMMLETELIRLRQSLGHRIRKLVRVIPEIALYLDDTIDEMYRVDELMSRLHKDGQMGKE